jgi:hypothetical protein
VPRLLPPSLWPERAGAVEGTAPPPAPWGIGGVCTEGVRAGVVIEGEGKKKMKRKISI